jgi:hypothetical protein
MESAPCQGFMTSQSAATDEWIFCHTSRMWRSPQTSPLAVAARLFSLACLLLLVKKIHQPILGRRQLEEHLIEQLVASRRTRICQEQDHAHSSVSIGPFTLSDGNDGLATLPGWKSLLSLRYWLLTSFLVKVPSPRPRIVASLSLRCRDKSTSSYQRPALTSRARDPRDKPTHHTGEPLDIVLDILARRLVCMPHVPSIESMARCKLHQQQKPDIVSPIIRCITELLERYLRVRVSLLVS